MKRESIINVQFYYIKFSNENHIPIKKITEFFKKYPSVHRVVCFLSL